MAVRESDRALGRPWTESGLDLELTEVDSFLIVLSFGSLPATTTVGYTVTIYHISVEQANRVRRDLGLPDIGANQSRGSHDFTTDPETQLRGTLFGRFRWPH